MPRVMHLVNPLLLKERELHVLELCPLLIHKDVVFMYIHNYTHV